MKLALRVHNGHIDQENILLGFWNYGQILEKLSYPDELYWNQKRLFLFDTFMPIFGPVCIHFEPETDEG